MEGKIENLRCFGKRKSLSDRDIDICILKSLNVDEPSIDKRLQLNKTSCLTLTCRRIFLLLVISCLLFATLVLCVVFLTILSDDFKSQVIRIGHNYMYPVMRMVRLMALPVLRYVQLHDYHDALCLIDNPYYEQGGQEFACNICKQTPSFDAAEKMDAFVFQNKYFSPMRTVLVKNNSEYVVSFPDLQRIYQRHPQMLKNGVHSITSSWPEISNYNFLMNNVTEEEILKSESFHLQWVSKRVGCSKFFSRIFPAPDYFLPERQFGLEKVLLLDSSTSEGYCLPRGVDGLDLMFYMQASGEKVLHFKPLSHCTDACLSARLHLQAGDTVFMHRGVWDIQSEPVETPDTERISMALLNTL